MKNPLKTEPAVIYGIVGYLALQAEQAASGELGTASLIQAGVVALVVVLTRLGVYSPDTHEAVVEGLEGILEATTEELDRERARGA